VLALLCLFIMVQVPVASAQNQPPPSPEGVSAINPGSDLWRDIRGRDLQFRELGDNSGVTQVKGVDSGVLINARGDQWARFRREELSKYGGGAIAGVFVILVLVYLVKGTVRIEGGTSGRMLQRYTYFQRVVHWTLAVVFLVLGLTGLILLLGRPLLIPLFGKEIFSLLASTSKQAHNLLGPLFAVSLIMMLISFISKNLYEKGDLDWLLKGGGAFSKDHPSAGFFNTGEKLWFWILMLVGICVTVTGLVLMFPSFGQGRQVMELSHVIHSIGALGLVCISFGHIYMGSVGIEGAYQGMKTGYVDINWANAHHDRWAHESEQQGLVLSAEDYARRQEERAGSKLTPESGNT